MNIGRTIRELRTQKGMEQQELAALLHVSNRTVSSWETNRTEPKMEMIEAICQALECSKSDFLESSTDYVITLSDKEKILIENYRKADAFDKTAVDRILKYTELFERRENGKSEKTT